MNVKNYYLKQLSNFSGRSLIDRLQFPKRKCFRIRRYISNRSAADIGQRCSRRTFNANVISPNAQEIGDRLYQCAYTYGTVSLIRADGKPEEFLKAKIPERNPRIIRAQTEIYCGRI